MKKMSLKTRITEMSEIPKDVVFGVPLITLVGQNEASVENYRGILEYTDKMIRIQTKIGKIQIIGSDLQIENYSNDVMKIIGCIQNIEFIQGGA